MDPFARRPGLLRQRLAVGAGQRLGDRVRRGDDAHRIDIGGDGDLEDGSNAVIAGWGWQDNGYGIDLLGPDIYFAQSGTHTIRVQRREDGVAIDQIVLSAGRFLHAAPGAVRNDATIVAR
ncbi:MAG TPA: hypothetical protein VH417_20290 [Vicinamibacterales bacterium]